jgi:hypothetical protein
VFKNDSCGNRERSHPCDAIGKIAEAPAEENRRPDRMGRTRADTLWAGFPNAPSQTRRYQRFMRVIAHFPFDSDPGYVESRALGDTPISIDPTAVGGKSDGGRVLPGERALLPPSPALLIADLTPASGRQDHTISPSALVSLVLRRHARPLHPAPTFVTMANAPLGEDGMAENVPQFPIFGKRFFGVGTGQPTSA